MRKLVYFVAATVDGHIASPRGEFDFFPLGEHFEAQVAELPETIPAHLRATVGAASEPRRFGAVVMGRKTYEVGARAGLTDPYAPLPTVVFSRTLATAESPVRVTAENPVDVVRALKRQPGRDIWLCGGGNLAASLADEIDELVVKLNPLLLGAGIALWSAPFSPRSLRLINTRTFASGVVWLTYALSSRASVPSPTS